MVSCSQPLPFSRPPAGDAVRTHSQQLDDSTRLLLHDPGLSKRFAAEDRGLTLANARIGCWFVILLMPMCTLLDMLGYPEHLPEFIALRISCSLIGLAMLLAINSPFGKKWYRLYPALLPIIPAFCVCYMIYLTGDPASSYYAGISFCLVATSFVFNWTFREIGFTLAIVLAAYFLCTLPLLNGHRNPQTLSAFLINTIFILLNCVVLFATSYQHHRIRVSEFVARCMSENQRKQLTSQNLELSETLRQLRETEAQLLHSEKLASIGRLSAGIIHEINNPLNFVKSAVFVLGKKCRQIEPQPPEQVKRILQDITEGVDRVAAIVADLRTFAHPDQHPSAPFNLAQCTHKALRLLSNEVHDHGVSVSVDIQPDLNVVGNESHLVQILINLVQNSIDALAGRDSPRIHASASRAADRIELRVWDNGSGIPKEILKSVFDPFFTTKQVGQGMGLGLSICFRMMEQMGGGIEVTSGEGQFTEFTLWFPCPPGTEQGGHR